MVVRKRKKKNKLRGHRSMGKGDTKNNRGGGSRGGRGRAGSKKHKRFSYLHEVGMLRKLKPKIKFDSLNLKDIDKKITELTLQKDSQKEDGLVVFDGKKQRIEKILSVGELKQKAFFKNVAFSKKAAEKIEKAGGKIENKKDTASETSKSGSKNETKTSNDLAAGTKVPTDLAVEVDKK